MAYRAGLAEVPSGRVSADTTGREHGRGEDGRCRGSPAPALVPPAADLLRRPGCDRGCQPAGLRAQPGREVVTHCWSPPARPTRPLVDRTAAGPARAGRA